MRRCTGFRPSRTSGMAREVMTDREYARNDSDISSATGTGTISRAKSTFMSRSSDTLSSVNCDCGGMVPLADSCRGKYGFYP